ncbi:unnamed protein product, partial [Scytosiphon promiscuus]
SDGGSLDGYERGKEEGGGSAGCRRGVVIRAVEGDEADGEDGGGLAHGRGAEDGAWEGTDYRRHQRRHSRSKEDVLRVSRGDGGHGGGAGGGSGDGAADYRTGSLVEIVAEFQGRLRRQVQAALADGSGGGGGVQNRGGKGQNYVAPSPSFSRVTTIGLVDGPLRLRQASEAGLGGIFVEAGRREEGGTNARERGSRVDILGQLEKRIGCV